MAQKKKNSMKKVVVGLLVVVGFVVVGAGGFTAGMMYKENSMKSANGTAVVANQSQKLDSAGLAANQQNGNNASTANQQNEETKSTIEQQMEDEESFSVDTPFTKLYYPVKWQSQVRVQNIEGDVYTVEFYGSVEGKAETHLFDIAFGGTDGFTVGNITVGDAVTNVNLVFAEIMLDETWTEEETNMIYAMQEDANYLLGMLEKEANFVPEP